MAAKKKPMSKKPMGKGSGNDLKSWDSSVNAIAEYGMKGWEGPKKDSRAVYKKFSAIKTPTAKDLAAVNAYVKAMRPLGRGSSNKMK